jgi:hypothetical protein
MQIEVRNVFYKECVRLRIQTEEKSIPSRKKYINSMYKCPGKTNKF